MIEIAPSTASGNVDLPSSKSETHRVLIASALSCQNLSIDNFYPSDDVMMTLLALKELGAVYCQEDRKITFLEGIKKQEKVRINCHESGSTLRFLIPLSLVFADDITFFGAKKLFSRPLSEYQKLAGIEFNLQEDSLQISGKLTPGEYRINGEISSQFITGLLFTLPLLDGDSTLIVEGNFESFSYVQMSLDVLALFNIKITYQNNTFFIKGRQKYHCTSKLDINIDYSQLAFFAVLGVTNADYISLPVRDSQIHQGDKVILDILKSPFRKSPFSGGEVDLSDCPDLGPILMVLGLFGTAPLRLNNIKRLRYKESDRVEAMRENLALCNGKVEVFDNHLIVYPSQLKAPLVALDPHNDHRIFMALSVMACSLDQPTKIKNPQCINKSYPTFLEDLTKVNVRWKYVER